MRLSKGPGAASSRARLKNMPKQNELEIKGEGAERKIIKPLEEAIEAWTAVKNKRMALTDKEIEAKAAVLVMMEKYEIEVYRFDDEHEVVLLDTVKIRKLEKPDGDE